LPSDPKGLNLHVPIDDNGCGSPNKVISFGQPKNGRVPVAASGDPSFISCLIFSMADKKMALADKKMAQFGHPST
jgi:hypothetical protein